MPKNETLRGMFPDEDVERIEGTDAFREGGGDYEEQTWTDDFRYVNLGPVEVKRRLDDATDPEEVKALMIALEFWKRRRCPHEAGEPVRGCRET